MTFQNQPEQPTAEDRILAGLPVPYQMVVALVSDERYVEQTHFNNNSLASFQPSIPVSTALILTELTRQGILHRVKGVYGGSGMVYMPDDNGLDYQLTSRFRPASEKLRKQFEQRAAEAKGKSNKEDS